MHANVLPMQRGVEWELLDPARRAEMVSAAISVLVHMGAEAHAKVLALKRGVEWGRWILRGEQKWCQRS